MRFLRLSALLLGVLTAALSHTPAHAQVDLSTLGAPPGGVQPGDVLVLERAGTPPHLYGAPTTTFTGSGVGITTATITAGHLVLTKSDGTSVDAGQVVGTSGTNGNPGAAGVGIASAVVNGAGHLILTRSDASTIDAGYVVGPAGAGGAGSYTLPAATSSTLGGVIPGTGFVIAGGVITPDSTIVALRSALSAAAFSGAYADLTGRPTIPSNTNQLVNGAGFLTSAPVASVAGRTGAIVLSASDISGLSAVATSGAYASLTGLPTIPPAFTLAPAASGVLGGVKPSSTIAVAGDGTASLAQNGATSGQVPQWNGSTWLPATVTTGGTTYTLPTASASVLGGIKIGAGLSIAGDGTVSSSGASYTLPPATVSVLGGVKPGANIAVAGDGTISTAAPYSLTSAGIASALGFAPVNPSSLAAVATSGAYSSLTGLPTIPTNTNQLTNGAGFLTTAPVASVAGRTGAITLSASDVSGLASVATSGAYGSLTGTPTLLQIGTTAGTAADAGALATSLAGKLAAASNLSDVASVATARTNLGLATVAASGSYLDLSNRPAVLALGTTAGTAAAGNDSRIVGAAQTSALSAGSVPIPYSALTGTPSPVPFVRSAYTTSGALASTDTLSLLNCSSACALTLAAGTTDGQTDLIKNIGTAGSTVTANIDGTASTVVTFTATAAGTIRDSVRLRWSATDSTWFAE